MVLKFYERAGPPIDKPVMIAAMPDMGNVGRIVIDFINEFKETKVFRIAKTPYPNYVVDRGGYIDIPDEEWTYRYADGLIVFGGGGGYPLESSEVHAMCQDVIDVARRYSAKFIYTVGGFHNQTTQNLPKAFVTASTKEIATQLKDSGFDSSPPKSIIRGFNGVVLGYAKANGIHGIGVYGEISEPTIPQYRAAKSVIKVLERLTYQRFGNTSKLDLMASYVEKDR